MKIIDLVKMENDKTKCPNCITNRRSFNGEPVIFCLIDHQSETPSLPDGASGHSYLPCTIDDWNDCPFNSKNQG